MSKKTRKASTKPITPTVPLECSAGEYFWLCNELTKARRALQASLFNGSKPEETQAYAILVDFYQKAAKAFHVRPDSSVMRPIVISKQFLAGLKSLDREGFIDLALVRKGEISEKPA